MCAVSPAGVSEPQYAPAFSDRVKCRSEQALLLMTGLEWRQSRPRWQCDRTAGISVLRVPKATLSNLGFIKGPGWRT